MKLKDFITTFSHNNEIWVQNKDGKKMGYRYKPTHDYMYDIIMDWELLHTDIAECEVIRIANVVGYATQGITIVINTEKRHFDFVPELVTMDNSPVWLYERVHNTKLAVGDAIGSAIGETLKREQVKESVNY